MSKTGKYSIKRRKLLYFSAFLIVLFRKNPLNSRGEKIPQVFLSSCSSEAISRFSGGKMTPFRAFPYSLYYGAFGLPFLISSPFSPLCVRTFLVPHLQILRAAFRPLVRTSLPTFFLCLYRLLLSVSVFACTYALCLRLPFSCDIFARYFLVRHTGLRGTFASAKAKPRNMRGFAPFF